MATENEMTIPEMDELTAEELAAADPTGLATLLYVIRGLGADRDRSMNLEEFAKFIGSIFSALKVYDDVNKKTVKIENGEISAFNNINRLCFVLSWLGFKIDGDGFTLKANGDDGLKLSTNDASFTANSSYFEYGFIYQDKEYNLTMDNASLRLTNTVDEIETTVFEIKLNGHIDELNYDKLGGIIDLSRVVNPKIYENEQVVAKQNVEGASFKFHVQGGTKLYFDRRTTVKYLTILDGTTHAVVEFVNVVFDRGRENERIELVPCFNATVGSDTIRNATGE